MEAASCLRREDKEDDEKHNKRKFWTQTGRSQADLAVRTPPRWLQFWLWPFCRGLMKEPREKMMEKSCVAIPEEMQQEAASAEKVTVCGDGENGGCLVLLRRL